MKSFILSVLITTLSAAATVIPQRANADYPYNNRPRYYREEHPRYYREEHPRYYREEHPRYYRGYDSRRYERDYYPHEYYYRGYERYPRSRVELIVPLIFR